MTTWAARSASQGRDPVEMQEFGLYHPDHGHFSGLEDFLQKTGYDDSLPTVGISSTAVDILIRGW